MPSRERQIEALLQRAKVQLCDIMKYYNTSLTQKTVADDLKIEIKIFGETLRSALDYLAHDIRETYCPNRKRGKFYFPILSDHQQYRNQMSKWYPGLDKNAPSLWNYLESVQPYKRESSAWLGRFNRLVNENKHDSLVPQTRSCRERVHVKTKSGEANWDHKGVRFSRGTYIFGVPIDPSTQMPVPHSSQTVRRINWVDFHFNGIKGSALKLLKDSLEGIEKIVSKTRKWL